MSTMKYRRLSAQIAVSLALAAITPAAAAGLVEGVKMAATTVDDATGIQSIAPDDGATATAPDAKKRIATAAPRRLSELAGDDTRAWTSAKAIRVPPARKPAY